MSTKITITEEALLNKIYIIREEKVMLDRDLATLYGVETKRLKEAVRRNSERFPKDFMFELETQEVNNLRSQIATSSWGGNRYVPMVFTEQGVAMLSSVLKSKNAIAVNIQIIRVFSKMRKLFTNNVGLRLEIEEIKKKVSNQSKNIELVFSYLDELIDKKETSSERRKIGYKK